MIAAIDNMVCQDSSSEDEDLEKFKEATWTFQKDGTNGTNSSGEKGDEMQSRRVIVSQHEHDGNELQTSPEFKEHVAKKLGSMLDSSISEISAETISHTDVTYEEEEAPEGFRLFTTSIPEEEVEEQPPVRRRPIPSSSDSDSEMETRLREAAVSITDFLPPSSLYAEVKSALPESPSTLPTIQATSTKKKKNKKKKKRKTSPGELMAEGENIPVSKKNKKQTASQEQCEDVEGKMDVEISSPKDETKVEAKQKGKRRRKKKSKQKVADERE